VLDFPVRYNGVDLNTTVPAGEGKRYGNQLEAVDFGRSQARAYTAPRAQDDGLDASDVFMGPRYINLTGATYGSSPGDLHDRLQGVRTALTPTVAYNTDEPDYGYIPLEFVLPTEHRDDFPDGTRLLQFFARPTGQPQFVLQRDGGGAIGAAGPEKGGGIMWRSTLECKDPRMYVRPQTLVPWTAATPAGGSPLVNRGDYPAPLDILIVLGAATTLATAAVQIDVGLSNMTILMWTVGPPAVGFPVGTIFRYSSAINVLTVQTPTDLTDVTRMDLLQWRNNTSKPFVQPGDSTFAVRPTGVTLGNGTRFMYNESFA
jgi:hypothetical protein